MSTAFGMATPYVNGAAKEIADGVGLALNTTFSAAEVVSDWIPGSRMIFRYVRASHQNDPFRTLLEILLVVFMFWYFGRKQQKPGFNDLELTPKVNSHADLEWAHRQFSTDIVRGAIQEVQELIDEWEPEPLVPPLTDFQKAELEKLPIITGCVPSGDLRVHTA